jgi:hypothetical protein
MVTALYTPLSKVAINLSISCIGTAHTNFTALRCEEKIEIF